MQISHCNYLKCISCGNSLTLVKGYTLDKENVKTGIVKCTICRMQFPVIRFVPRLLKGEMLKECLFYYFESDIKSNLQLHTFYKELSQKRNFKLNWTEAKKIETLRSFGFEWTKWSKLPDFAENLFWEIMGKDRQFFQGKKGWDPACGMGRDLYNAVISVGDKGLMIGSDISYAVDSAYKRCKDFKNVLIVQADLYSSFIKDNFLDFVFMIGVVQHLTDPHAGVEAVLRKLKKRGYFVATIYHQAEDRLGKIFTKFIYLMRIFTRHLPYKWILIICQILAVPSYLFFCLPYFVLKRFRYIQNLELAYPNEKLTRRKPDFNYYACILFDHFTAPIINYYSDREIMKIFKSKYLIIKKYEHGFIRGVRA